MERFIPEIRQGFTDNKGRYFPNIREIAYEKGKTFNSFGVLIGQSGNMEDEYVTDGVYVFRSYVDSGKVYRIYKDFTNPTFDSCEDAKFISDLLNQSKGVKLSEFPTGVITEGGRIIGQEVPFAQGITLGQFSKNNQREILPTRIYIQVLDIIKELYLNKIYYLDIHEKNFIINDGIIKLIDFDSFFMRIGNITISDKKLIFDYLKMMLNQLNENFGIKDNFNFIDGMDDAYEKVLKLEEKLINRG